MKNKKYLLFGTLATVLLVNVIYASEYEYEDDDRYEYEERYEYKYDDSYERTYNYNYQKEYYISPNNLPISIRNYINNNYNADIIKVEKKSYGYEVKLSNGIELKFDNNGKLLYRDYEDYYKYNKQVQISQSYTINNQYKYLTSSIREKIDRILEVKLFSKISNLDNQKKIEILNKILDKVNTKSTEIKSKTNLTRVDEIKLEILDYLKYKIEDYMSKFELVNTEGILNEILNF